MQNVLKEHLFSNSKTGERLKKEVNQMALVSMLFGTSS